MQPAPKPENEKARQKALDALEVLDTEIEQCFDEITELAAKLCDVPICLISLIDKERQWFKSHYGLAARETPREFAFCAHAILDKKVFIVPDAMKDERFFDNPLVTGDPHVIFYAGQPLDIGEDNQIGTLCLIDNKPRKISKEKLKILKVLAHQVEAQFKLRQNVKQLIIADRMKDEFLANMSHELRTPASGLIGMLELLKDTPLSEGQLEYVESLDYSANQLLSLLNDILDLSKIEAGKIALDIREFDLLKAIGNTIRSLHGVAVKKRNKLIEVISPDVLQWVKTDETRLQQILLNLIGNALKFTENGTIVVTVSRSAKKEEIYFQIKDTGIGIPKDKQELIFEAFSQADQSTVRKYGGTGLGLAICQKLVQSFGGQISVQSQEGVGSTFAFSIACESSKAPAKKKERQPTEEPQTKYQHLTVLICEDNEINQMVASTILKKMNIEHSIVATGLQAIEELELNQYDVVLMDARMPVLDGYESTKRIRGMELEKQPIIIGLTADAFTGARDLCLDCGMDEYIAKPVSLKKLLEIFAALFP